MRQVLIIDMNVIAHGILAVIESLGTKRYDLNKVVEAQMLWCQSGRWLRPDLTDANYVNGFLPFNTQPVVIWCMDSKPYWRTEYLLRDSVWSKIVPVKRRIKQVPAPMHYKGGRKKPPTALNLIRSSMRMVIIKNGWNLLEGMADSSHGYEADDMAALLCRLNAYGDNNAKLYLMTCDHDWIGLIDQHTSWLNTYGAFPRYRNMSNWNTGYSLPALDPTALWTHKAKTGDKSDNLPNVGGDPDSVAALLPVISLNAPPVEYDPLLDMGIVMSARRFLESNAVPFTSEQDETLARLSSSGMPLCMKVLTHSVSS